MSAFKNKIREIRQNDNSANNHNIRHVCSATQLQLSHSPNPKTKNQLCIKEPIYISKKNKKTIETKKVIKNVIPKVEKFEPIQIPQSPPSVSNRIFKQWTQHTAESTQCGNKQIQIHIDNDDKNKLCLKKLFKKIHTLSDNLAASQKERVRLQLQLNNLKGISQFNREQQKNGLQLDAENYKLRVEIDLLKGKVKEKEKEIQKIKNQTPNQIIKEVVVEKPVQVKVQVPKYVPGPQKIVEVYKQDPKFSQQLQYYKERINKLEQQLERANRQLQKYCEANQIPEIIEKPIYLQKPIYIDKPVYIEKEKVIEKPVERQRIVEIPIEVPYEVPVYLEKPILDEQFIDKINELEKDVERLVVQKEELISQNSKYRTVINFLQSNMEVLRRHNTQKNRQIEDLLNNIDDYDPVKVHKYESQTKYKKHSPNIRQPTYIQSGVTFKPF